MANGRRAEPRLAWAYVREDLARDAGIGILRLGRDAPRHYIDASDAIRPSPEGIAYGLIPVSAYAHFRPRHRPASYCPVCHERVWLKLGRTLRHHYAHRARSACGAAGAEGALHLAAKLHLGEVLSDSGPLRLRHVCHRVPQERSHERCEPSAIREWPVAWDEVRVEYAMPAVRADLMLLWEGAAVAAVEVYSTHRVDPEKAARYRALGLPWLEISARDVLTDHGSAWSPDQPLAVIGDSELHPGVWRCRRHQAVHQAFLEHERTGVHPLAFRIVHLYRTDGGLSRGVLRTETVLIWMRERRVEGEIVEAWLERDDTEARLRPSVRVRDREEAKRLLHAHFRGWVRWIERTQGIVAESPMPWLHGEPEAKRERGRLYPQRLRWEHQSGGYIGAPAIPTVAWPTPLQGSGDPHPVLGYTPCYWTARGDEHRLPLTHAIVGACWLTLRLSEWSWEDRRHARADFRLHHHDGVRWVSPSAASHSVTHAAGAIDWAELLPRVAGTVAGRVGEIEKDPRRFATLVDEEIGSELGTGSAHPPPGSPSARGGAERTE